MLQERLRTRHQPDAHQRAPIRANLAWRLQATHRPTDVAQRRAHATWVSARDSKPIHAERLRVRKHGIGSSLG